MPKKLTQEEFIRRSSKMHDGKYDYSQVRYTTSAAKVVVICPEHGKFEQLAKEHMKGQGCRQCGYNSLRNKYALGKELFIKSAVEVHGDKYDYSKVAYVNSQTSVEITCPDHGTFWQRPANHCHMRQKCPKCSEVYPITQQDFVLRSSHIHQGKYDYSKTVYKAALKKLCIICPIHGEFWQKASCHMLGRGCDKCGGSSDVTMEEFKKRASEKYNNKYDYSKVASLKNMRSKVEIICPEHGSFVQQAGLHLRAETHGCQACAEEIRRGKRSLGTQIFIERAKKKHGDKYGYDKVAYQHAHANVTILCGVHGYFSQTAHTHLKGSGCPVCQESTGERAVRVWLEANRIPHKQEKYIRGIGWFDFVVKTATGIGIIEFQGHQHYFPVDFGSKKTTGLQILESNVKRDYKKKQWCLSRGYSYLPIPYWDIGQIPAILAAYFAGKNPVFTNPPEEVVIHQEYRESVLKGGEGKSKQGIRTLQKKCCFPK